jgi:hypothetical protein
MNLISIESPFAASETHAEDEHVDYARRACRFAVLEGVSPYASHLFFTQPNVLDDNVPAERDLGIRAGKAWEVHAKESWFFIDLGFSAGMEYGLKECLRINRPFKFFMQTTDGSFAQCPVTVEQVPAS